MDDKKHSSPCSVGTKEVVYENPHQRIYKVCLEFGAFSKHIFVNDYGHRAGVLVEGDKGILLTRQYRYLIERVSWEIPGGKVDTGECLEAAAQRECLEETGVLCHRLKPLLMFYPGLDTLYNPSHLFYTDNYEEAGAIPHGDEVSSREWVPLDECLSMISSQMIVDSFSVIALLSYSTFIKRK